MLSSQINIYFASEMLPASSQPSSQDLMNPPQSPQKVEKVNTKNMFVYYPQNNKQEATYYIPAYLRVKMKNITELCHQSLQGSANMVLILDISTEDLDEEIVEYLKRNLIMRFNRDDAIILDPKKNYDVKMKNLQEKKLLRFTVRKILKANMKNHADFTPAETVQLIASISLPAVEIPMEDYDQFMKEHSENQKIKKNPVRYRNLQLLTLRFNFMDLKDKQKQIKKFVKFSFTTETKFGQYIFSHTLRKVDFSNESILSNFSYQNTLEDKQLDPIADQQEDYKEYCHAHIIIPLRRNSTVATWTLLIPLIVLGFFNTGIFLQGQYLPERFGNWITLMIAFVAFIPVIRDRLPPNPTVTFMEGLLLTHIFATTLGFFDGFYQKIYGEKNHVLQASVLAISAIPLILDIWFFLCLLITFGCQNKKLSSTNGVLRINEKRFNPAEWSNSFCQEYFSNHKNAKHILTYQEYKQTYKTWWDKVKCSRMVYNQKVKKRIEYQTKEKQIKYDNIKQICQFLTDKYISQKGVIIEQKMQSESD